MSAVMSGSTSSAAGDSRVATGDARRPRREQVACAIEMVNTADDCYAHVVLEGVEVGPGDEVLVHDAPTHLPYGSHRLVSTRATVTRAGWWARLWTHLGARFELDLLYEVSFTSARFPAIDRTRAYPRPRARGPQTDAMPGPAPHTPSRTTP